MLERLESMPATQTIVLYAVYVSIQEEHMSVSKHPLGLPTLSAPYTKKFGMGEEKKSFRSTNPPIVVII